MSRLVGSVTTGQKTSAHRAEGACRNVQGEGKVEQVQSSGEKTSSHW